MTISNLPVRLFWDTDISTIDVNKNARFIIHRVIERGTLANWKTIKQFYGLEKIKEEILNIKSLDVKTLNFFSIYFELDKTDFRCYSTIQSNPKHFNY